MVNQMSTTAQNRKTARQCNILVSGDNKTISKTSSIPAILKVRGMAALLVHFAAPRTANIKQGHSSKPLIRFIDT